MTDFSITITKTETGSKIKWHLPPDFFGWLKLVILDPVNPDDNLTTESMSNQTIWVVSHQSNAKAIASITKGDNVLWTQNIELA